MLIHRIAHPLVKCADAGTPVGPYNAYSAASSQGMDDDLVMLLREVADFLCSRLDPSHTPPPYAEGHYIHAGREQSVFLNETQAQGWFRDGVEAMRDAGFCWLTYEIQEKYVRATRTQAIALVKRARLVSIQDIPFSSDPEYVYCTYCGYDPYCSCYVAQECCGSIGSMCFCYLDSDNDGIQDCGTCGAAPWACVC